MRQELNRERTIDHTKQNAEGSGSCAIPLVDVTRPPAEQIDDVGIMWWPVMVE
jgi:hypothetical protein